MFNASGTNMIRAVTLTTIVVISTDDTVLSDTVIVTHNTTINMPTSVTSVNTNAVGTATCYFCDC